MAAVADVLRGMSLPSTPSIFQSCRFVCNIAAPSSPRSKARIQTHAAAGSVEQVLRPDFHERLHTTLMTIPSNQINDAPTTLRSALMCDEADKRTHTAHAAAQEARSRRHEAQSTPEEHSTHTTPIEAATGRDMINEAGVHVPAGRSASPR